MGEDPELERVIEDFEARQSTPGMYRRSFDLPDSITAPVNATKGSSYVVTFIFLLLALALFVYAFVKNFEDYSIFACVVALVPLTASYLLFRGIRAERKRNGSISRETAPGSRSSRDRGRE